MLPIARTLGLGVVAGTLLGASLIPPALGVPEAAGVMDLNLGGANLAVATTSVVVANSLTASGLHVAPRYMSQPGDVDMSLLGGFVNYPKLGGNLVGGQLSLQAKVTESLVLLADAGQQTSLGVRGPLFAQDSWRLGWDLHYRSDLYFNQRKIMGLGSPGFGLVPNAPGGMAQGGELALNGEYAWGPLRAYLTPQLSIMSNRDAVGVTGALDWDLGRITLGLGSSVLANWGNPAGSAVALQPVEVGASAGLRLFLTDWAYLQANYRYLLGDAYGSPQQAVLSGFGTRLRGNFSPPVVLAAQPLPAPSPEPLPTPVPAPLPTLEPAAVEAPRPVPASLVGRVLHSLLPGGDPGKPVRVALKLRGAGGNWKSLPQVTQSDSLGRYVFQELPAGDYEVVYRADDQLPNCAGAAVAAFASVKDGATATADLDIAWDETSIKGSIQDNRVSVEWSPKPGVEDLIYQVVLKYAPDQPFVVGTAPSAETRAQFDVSDEVKSHTVYYTVKYWKRTGAFEGDVPYGQSKYRVLERVK